MKRRLLAPIAALVTLAVLGSAGGATAAWIASASVSASVSSATIGTTVTQTGALTTTYRYAGTTSPVAAGQLTIANNGGAPLSYTLRSQLTGSAALGQQTTLRLWTGTCGTTAPSDAIVTTMADTAPTLPTAARALAAGASVTVCLSTQVQGGTNAALQGQSATTTFSVSGSVGTNWTTSAAAASFTQSAYRLASAGAPACAPVDFTRDVRLTWNAPANRADTAALSYRVFNVASGATVATVTSAAATVSVVLTGGDISRSGTYSLAVEAKETVVSGTTAPASAPVTVSRSIDPLDILQLFPRYSCS
ncbi:hypothetical protein [Microbacterium timonense]|uniref:hypothetical protein n=1 Tax=Microbacterium timonense TaxID=2086576 RepID=UPI00135AC507|nr:hypothetical protein [Microbacterium timonense]